MRKSTGIVRRVDSLGRVVIPKELRRIMHIRENDALEIFTGNNGEIIYSKYSFLKELKDISVQYAGILRHVSGYPVAICDRENCVSASGLSGQGVIDCRMSDALGKRCYSGKL